MRGKLYKNYKPVQIYVAGCDEFFWQKMLILIKQRGMGRWVKLNCYRGVVPDSFSGRNAQIAPDTRLVLHRRVTNGVGLGSCLYYPSVFLTRHRHPAQPPRDCCTDEIEPASGVKNFLKLRIAGVTVSHRGEPLYQELY
jgi:hypothetical protein